MTQAEEAERLVAHVLAALNEVDPGGVLAAIGDDPDWPERENEYRIEAEEIARRIRHAERDRSRLSERETAKIVRAVVGEEFSVRVPRRDGRETAVRICTSRIVDLVAETVAEAAAAPLADGRAALRRVDAELGGQGVELVPARPTAAGLRVLVEYETLLNLFVAGRQTIEVFSTDPSELLAELRELVQALISGDYEEEERDRGATTTIRARWPGGEYSSLDVSQGAGGPLTEWRQRAYDPYS